MKRRLGLSAVAILLMCGSASAEPIPAGVWAQASSTAGTCPECQIEVTQVTPDIISLTGNNQVVGFAYYDKMGDIYRGAMEFKSGAGGDFANTVLETELKSSGGTLTIIFQSIKGTIISTYAKKAQ
jgi:hypothetical protein